ncbi:MTOR-associated protein MEAK7 [Aplysia californica]|uniref:MTOR-associated protein MEAK7 n=1 Tax=Aplysia californica TaxID=6500 RepID=A0ABM0JW26_APLCA|nr:MTOR-associated protein MEAK7 [Aplysia californica]
MGGSESKSTDVKHELLFDEEEKSRVSSVFASISHGKKSFNKEQFLHFTSTVLDTFTSSRMYDLIEGPLPPHRQQHHQRRHAHHQHRGHEIQLQHFASHLGLLLKGNITDLAHSCIFLASTTPDSVSGPNLVKLVTNVLTSYERVLHAHCTAYQSWMFAASKGSHDNLANSLLKDLLHSDGRSVSGTGEKEETSKMFDVSDIEQWLSRSSLFTQVLRQVFDGAFQFYHVEPQEMVFAPKVPHVRDTNWSQCRTVLDFPTVLFLNFSVPPLLQTQWKLLFNSTLHGASFSQLLQRVRGKGPTYLIVKDKNGNVFGGFASIPWEINPKFTGDSSCFLFKACPDYSIYRPTGYNENFMYLNHRVQTLPNGLGMGGQLEYFGLWIDQEFDIGHSKAGAKGCTTYGSPQLSGDAEFQVDCLEVWAIGKEKRKDGEEDEDEEEDTADNAKGGEKSILDKMSSEDKAILEMVDRGTISDAMREEPIVEETAAHKSIISPF